MRASARQGGAILWYRFVWQRKEHARERQSARGSSRVPVKFSTATKCGSSCPDLGFTKEEQQHPSN
jgi:hypothetical protein